MWKYPSFQYWKKQVPKKCVSDIHKAWKIDKPEIIFSFIIWHYGRIHFLKKKAVSLTVVYVAFYNHLFQTLSAQRPRFDSKLEVCLHFGTYDMSEYAMDNKIVVEVHPQYYKVIFLTCY